MINRFFYIVLACFSLSVPPNVYGQTPLRLDTIAQKPQVEWQKSIGKSLLKALKHRSRKSIRKTLSPGESMFELLEIGTIDSCMLILRGQITHTNFEFKLISDLNMEEIRFVEIGHCFGIVHSSFGQIHQSFQLLHGSEMKFEHFARLISPSFYDVYEIKEGKPFLLSRLFQAYNRKKWQEIPPFELDRLAQFEGSTTNIPFIIHDWLHNKFSYYVWIEKPEGFRIVQIGYDEEMIHSPKFPIFCSDFIQGERLYIRKKFRVVP